MLKVGCPGGHEVTWAKSRVTAVFLGLWMQNCSNYSIKSCQKSPWISFWVCRESISYWKSIFESVWIWKKQKKGGCDASFQSFRVLKWMILVTLWTEVASRRVVLCAWSADEWCVHPVDSVQVCCKRLRVFALLCVFFLEGVRPLCRLLFAYKTSETLRYLSTVWFHGFPAHCNLGYVWRLWKNRDSTVVQAHLSTSF